MSPTPRKPVRTGIDDNAMLGIGLKLASVTVFIGMATAIKSADTIPLGQIIFFRSFFATVPILILLQWRGELAAGFRTNRFAGHLLRGVIGVSGMTFIFLALTRLPLPEATTLNYATPLFIVVLSAIVFRETVGIYRSSAVIAGMIGVVIVAWPRLTLFTGSTGIGTGETIGILAAFLGAFLAACATMATRSLVKTEQSPTIVLYFSLTCSALALLSLPFGWVMPSPTELALLLSAGFAGGVGQILLTESYRHADMSVIAPFDYASLILSIAIGYLVFGDLPTVHMIVGGLIVVGAGIFIILRERRLGLERAEAKRVSTPQG